MRIFEIKDKNIWEDFLQGVGEKTFLQSWAWGEFQKAMGEKIWRLGMYEEEELVGVCLVVKISARRGRFLFVPQGPIISSKFKVQSEKLQFKIKNLFQSLKELAKKERCSFIRISPILEDTKENNELFEKLGFRDAPSHMHAELSWVLDISKLEAQLPMLRRQASEQELLGGMRKTTRNLVGRGEREGVEVGKGTLEEFYALYQETEKRQQFVAFSKEYLQKEMEAFNTKYKIQNTRYKQSAEIFLAEYQGKILAGAIIVFYGDTAYYHHGASLHSKIPAAYTLQWEIMKEAKKHGILKYNFWGVVEEDDANHPWHGLSLFKRGFGGQEWRLMHAKDIPLSWRYWISWSIERARNWKRGY